MEKLRKLNAMLVLFVFIVMVLSGLIAGIAYILLSRWIPTPSGFAEQMVYLGLCMLFSVLIGTAATFAFAQKTLKPLSQLIRATGSVAEGDFSVRVKEIRGMGDLGQLARSFNHMAEELGSLELLRSDFTNNFSHEFKTPLTSILGFAKQLERDDLPDGERREYARIIASEARRLSAMSGNVLLLSRLETQKIVTGRAPFRLDEQLRRVLVTLEKRWSAKRIDLDINLDDVTYVGNEEMLSHVWLNILDNAIKFTGAGGNINVSLWQTPQEVVVDIGDNGKGMDGFTRSRIFEKFYQADPTRSTEGNGLGLPLANRIVTLSGGRIDVESEPGKGTLFSIHLPKVQEE